MKALKFKTNINCEGCVTKVSSTLNELVGEGNWQVDTLKPEKILILSSDYLDESLVKKSLEKAGFKAEKIS